MTAGQAAGARRTRSPSRRPGCPAGGRRDWLPEGSRRPAGAAAAARPAVPPVLERSDDLHVRGPGQRIAMPLAAVLVLHAGAADMGYLSALEWLPSLLFALPAGALVDRRGHRRATMIGADLGRFVLLGSVPVCYALGVLTLPQLFAVAFCAGTLSIVFAVSDGTLFVSLVPADQYVEGNSLVYASRALSFVGGPSLGGLMVQALSAPLAIGADALSFLGSAAQPGPDPAGRAADGRWRAGRGHRRGPVHPRFRCGPCLPAGGGHDQLLQLHVRGPVRPVRDPGPARAGRAAGPRAGRRRGRRRAGLGGHQAGGRGHRRGPGLRGRLRPVHLAAPARAAGRRTAADGARLAVPGRVRVRFRGDGAGHQHRCHLRRGHPASCGRG